MGTLCIGTNESKLECMPNVHCFWVLKYTTHIQSLLFGTIWGQIARAATPHFEWKVPSTLNLSIFFPSFFPSFFHFSMTLHCKELRIYFTKQEQKKTASASCFVPFCSVLPIQISTYSPKCLHYRVTLLHNTHRLTMMKYSGFLFSIHDALCTQHKKKPLGWSKGICLD